MVDNSLIDELVKLAANAVAGTDDYKNLDKHKEKDGKRLATLKKSLGGQTGYKHIELEITDRITAIKGSDYETIFEDYLIDPISGRRRSFMRPNRRQHNMAGTFRLPGLVKRKVKSNRLAHLIYSLDVSG